MRLSATPSLKDLVMAGRAGKSVIVVMVGQEARKHKGKGETGDGNEGTWGPGSGKLTRQRLPVLEPVGWPSAS